MQAILNLAPPVIFIGFHVLEALFPARRRAFSLRWRIQGFIFWGMAGAIVTNAPRLWADAAARYHLLPLPEMPLVASVLLTILLTELMIYGWHRARHRSPVLWRVHVLHHSAERFDISGAFFFHPLEPLSIAIITSLSGSFILGVPAEAAQIAGIFGFSCACFQHANVRTPRWLGYIIQRPESHSVHHGRNVHAFNYCDLPIIDMLFGTFRNPADFEEEQGYWDGASRLIPQMLAFADVSDPAYAQGGSSNRTITGGVPAP